MDYWFVSWHCCARTWHWLKQWTSLAGKIQTDCARSAESPAWTPWGHPCLLHLAKRQDFNPIINPCMLLSWRWPLISTSFTRAISSHRARPALMGAEESTDSSAVQDCVMQWDLAVLITAIQPCFFVLFLVCYTLNKLKFHFPLLLIIFPNFLLWEW